MTNEKKYKTPEEREEAFNDFCGQALCDGCPIIKKPGHCQFNWLALEAEKETPLPCPFCGGNDIYAFTSGFGCVKCQSCEAAMSADTEAEAIAKWNRRVK